jgi:myo-inositol-1(or 4)-monophosphatase
MSELDAAITIARRTGEYLRANWGRTDIHVEQKGVIDPVSEIDKYADAAIKAGLVSAFQHYGILTEESDYLPGHIDARWIVDPLDGTINYLRGIPLVAVSIGLEKEGKLVLGVVYNPILDELYTAESGKGAFFNGKPIQVSSIDSLSKSLIISGFPYDAWTSEQDNLAQWGRLVKQCMSVRCDGSAALDMCALACGRCDAYYELGTFPWDVAAGTVIVREAGGMVSDYSNGSQFFSRKEIVATNGRVHNDLLSILAS